MSNYEFIADLLLAYR